MNKKVGIIFIVFIFLFGSLSFSKSIETNRWLVIENVPVNLPAFVKDSNSSKIKYLLNFKHFDTSELFPSEGEFQFLFNGKKYFWKSSGLKHSSVENSIFYAVSYLNTDRFSEGKLKVLSDLPFLLYFDGKSVAKKDDVSDKKEFTSSPLKIETGKHIVFLKVLNLSNKISDIKVSFIPDEKFENANIDFSISPLKHVSLKEILDVEKVNSLKINPDGKSFAMILSKRVNGKAFSWIEIRDVIYGRLLKSYKYIGKLSNFKWKPEGRAFTFVNYGKNGADLILVDNGNEPRKILSGEKDFSDYRWSPDGSFIVYSKIEKHKEYINGLKQLLSTEDRQRGNRNKSFLYLLYPDGGFKMRITAGENSVYLLDIGKNGKILFSTMGIDYKKRPYTYSTFYCLDTKTLKYKKLFKSYWTNFVKWYDDNTLIALGGPESFDKIGMNLKVNKIPNPYDVQAYFYDLKTKKVTPLTKDFKPAIDNVFFGKNRNKIYFMTTDKSYKRLYEYDVKKKKFRSLINDIEYIAGFSFAMEKNLVVFWGNNSNTPPKVYSLNLKNGKHRMIYYPAKEGFARVKFGKTENWNFKNSDGYTIIGRIYYPPDFDSTKKYPLIIYYYGGTVPVTRDFGGRYPKNYWAANGYVVYVLQPRGATGFGQDFSAFHVNGWGGKPIDDIIEGAKKFLKVHPFVKEDKVGIIGASYGGYTTEYLITRTDMFAAAVSHAGISLLPHYWGEGYWGYTYSAGATAFSFPWNRKDIYVDKSPLFNADKIKTPLLLLHGDSDTNVPTGESDQLYTALKLLGRPVEYIKVQGQDHWVLDYKKRILWSKTIVAWFDRWLKDQPEFWYSMYKKTK